MCPEVLRFYMSAEQQYPMGMHHMTVVPENFDPFDEPDIEDDGAD